jgi:cell division transport system ATP-binding protein
MFELFSRSPQKKAASFGGISLLREGDYFSLCDVNVEFGPNRVLENIQFNFQRGEFLFVTGDSGAGKTTLLKVISGLQDITNGRYERSNREFFCSQVFQDLRLVSKWTCERNLWCSYDSAIYKDKKAFADDIYDLCRYLGIQDKLHLKISEANRGLQQKIAMVRALLAKPDVLIVDEPTSSLDKGSAHRIYDLLSIYNLKKGVSVIWATHNQELVRSFSGRMLHLDKGKIIYSGHACFI